MPVGGRTSGRVPHVTDLYKIVLLGVLQVLSLSHNRLEGSLPASWAAMSALQAAYLEGNRLSGDLPARWAELPSLAFL